jgi:hypothetical protein
MEEKVLQHQRRKKKRNLLGGSLVAIGGFNNSKTGFDLLSVSPILLTSSLILIRVTGMSLFPTMVSRTVGSLSRIALVKCDSPAVIASEWFLFYSFPHPCQYLGHYSHGIVDVRRSLVAVQSDHRISAF